MKILAPKTVRLKPIETFRRYEIKSIHLRQVVVYDLYDIGMPPVVKYSIPVECNMSMDERVSSAHKLEHYRFEMQHMMFKGLFNTHTNLDLIDDNIIIVLKDVKKFNIDINYNEYLFRNRFTV